MKRSRRCFNLNSEWPDLDDTPSEESLIKGKDSSSEVATDSHQDHHDHQGKRVRMFDLNEVYYGDIDSGCEDFYNVNRLEEEMIHSPPIKRESPPKFFIGEESDESDGQNFREICPHSLAFCLRRSVSLDIKEEPYDDSQTPVPSISSEEGKGKSPMTSDTPDFPHVELASSTPKTSNWNDPTTSDPPSSSQFQLGSDTLDASNSDNPAPTLRTEELGSLTDESSIVKLLGGSEVDEKWMTDLVQPSEQVIAPMVESNLVTGLVPKALVNGQPEPAKNTSPPSKAASASVFVPKPLTGSITLSCLKPAMVPSPVPHKRMGYRKSNVKVLVKTRPSDSAPGNALKSATPHNLKSNVVIRPRPVEDLFPIPYLVPPTFSSMHTYPSPFMYPFGAMKAIPVKDVDYMKNLVREHREDKQGIQNSNLQQTGGCRNIYPWVMNLKSIREKKPIAPKTRYLTPCMYVTQLEGCLKGSECPYLHDSNQSPIGKVVKSSRRVRKRK